LSAPDFNWPELFGRIRCPALLITADPALGSLVTAQHAAELQAWLPQVQIEHVAGAGHSIRRDQRARFWAALEPFLRDSLDAQP
jgi:pimeloyl-ACP methyl ester carboxylesterase